MSKTFATFRRYQQTLLVIFGILLVFAWTVGGRSGRGPSDGGGPSEDAVVATWTNGSLSQNGLQKLRRTHQVAVRFVGEAMAHAVSLGEPERGFPILGALDDRNLVRYWLLAERAREMGVQFSDEAIVQWLNGITNNRLNAQKFREILGEGVSQAFLFDALRFELRAIHMRSMLASGVMPAQIAPSPTVAWDLYNRIQRRLVFEFMPVNVSEFVDQVPDPSDVELTALYEQFKDRFPDPRSPDPGFKVPLRRAISYVKFNTEEGLQAEMAQVTDAEIKEYYDSHLDDFKVTEDLDELLKSVPDAAPAPNSETPAAETPASEAPAAEAPAAVPPTTETPATETPAAETPATETPAAEVPAAETPATESPATETPSCGGDETTAGDEAAADAGSEQTNSDSPTTPSASEPAPPAEGSDAAPPAATTDAAPSDATPPADTKLDDLLQPPTSTDKAPQYQPLEKVSEQIRNILASPRLAEKVSQALSQVEKEMDDYYQRHLDWELNRDTNPEAPEPPQPDMAALAKKLGLSHAALPLLTGSDFVNDPEVGRAVQYVTSGERFRQEALVQKAFGPGVQLFRPARFGNAGYSNEYVYWATAQSEEHTPQFADCREAVLQAWKLQRAFEPALKKAQEFAQEARSSQKTLVDQFVSQKRSVFTPEPDNGLPWMTVSNVPIDQGGGIRLTNVPDMQYAGWQTLRDIFRLAPGEYGATPNLPKSVIYVVHVKGEKTSDSERRNRYLSPATADNILYLSMNEQAQVVNQQLEHLEQELQLKWRSSPQM